MAGDPNEAVFTVKEWLNRIDSKQDTLDEKLDRALERLENKADQRDLALLQERMTVQEQQSATRLELWGQLHKQLERNTDAIRGESGLQTTKADRADVSALWRVLVGALSGSAIAILAWALTLFVR